MIVKSGSVWNGLFVTVDATGALAAPSVGPTGKLYVDGVANAATVTITGSNPYKFSVTLPSLTAGQHVDMYITATISSIATAGIVASAQADTVLLSDGVMLADDAITAAKFDESTAFPLKSADTGATALARTGADSDTLETLSDEIAAVKAETASILADTGTDGVVVASLATDSITAAALKADAVTEIQNGLATAAALTTIDDFLDTEVAAILADTNELQTDLTNGGRLDMLIDAIKAKTDNLPADPADDSDIDAQLAAIKAETALIVEDTATTIPATLATIEGKIDTADTVVDAIKAKTDNLPTDPADDSDIDTAIAAVKTVVDAILVDTGTTLDGKITAILADTNELQAELADGGRTDLLIDAILEDTGTTIPGTITTIDNEVAVIDGIVDAILADTNELQTDLTDGGRLDLLIDAIKTETASILEDTGTDGVVLKAAGLDADAVTEIQSGLALEATLTAIKGAGWTTETLKAIADAISALNDPTPQQVWEYATRSLSTPSDYKADVSGLATTAHVQEVEDKVDNLVGDVADVFDDVGGIKAELDLVHAKTNNLPASPAPANEYDARMAAIQADLDNADQYKADVSAITGAALSAAGVDAILDEVVVGTYTMRQLLTVFASALAGKLSGGGTTTLTFRGINDASDVIVATVDANGNRSDLTITV